jgi:acyl-CoA synthetase (AMP-forming)/AMP-acid ligase II
MDPRWQNLSDPIFHCAETRGDAPALIEGPERLSYRALAVLVAKAAVYLRELGIGQGDRIGVALTSSIDHVILQFALLRIGATLIELATEDDPETLAATARQYGIRMIFTEAHTAAPPDIQRIRVDLAWRGRLALQSGDQRSSASGDALQVICLTTGSTGAPSGWVLTHRSIMRHAAIFQAWRYPEDEVMRPPANLLTVMPLRYFRSLASLLIQFAVGGPVVLLPELAKGQELLRAALAWDDTILSVTPNVCRHFLSVALESGLLLPRVRRLETGGQPLYAEEKQAILARVTPNFFDVYGSSAAGFISALNGSDMITHPNSVGRPASGIEVSIVDGMGRTLPAGNAGQIRLRPLMAQERYGESGSAPASGERIVDGWCYTGDIGHLDADGFLYLKGRGTDIIRRGSVEIFAPEIEAALIAHPNVADAAVVGVPVAGQSDQIVAFIVKRAEFAHDEIVRHCRERLQPGQLPDRVFYLDALPRIPGGKTNRLRLVEIAVAQLQQGAKR